MLIDMLTLTLRPGHLPVFLDRFETGMLALERQHCGTAMASLLSETGELNQFVQLRAYADAADRSRRQAALQTEPRWQHFWSEMLPLVDHRESRLLRPAAFSLPRGGP
ncbi:MAG: NIPSNAP family protein [Burkholderiaceae bacterium]